MKIFMIYFLNVTSVTSLVLTDTLYWFDAVVYKTADEPIQPEGQT